MPADQPATGLSGEEAKARLERDGPNALPEAARKGIFRIVFDVLREPMLALLVIGGVVYLVLGELQDALILVAFALFSVVITIVQEARTERVLRSLRELSSPKALVVRDGVVQRVAGTQVVAGDTVLLQEGDRVPADATVSAQTDLLIDESLLTGESVPVAKRARQTGEEGGARPGGDNLPFAYSGTLVVRGQGVAEVTATGPRSEIGRIGQSLVDLHPEVPRLQRETRRLTLWLGAFGAVVSVLAGLLYGLLLHNWLGAALAGIALAMSMLPEEFPVVLTVFLAMGAWRISRARVLTRRASAIEALGSASVLCTDKTGTLTENRMGVAAIRLAGGQAYTGLAASALPAAVEPFDPMDKAFHGLSPQAQPGWSLSRAYGLRSDLLAVVQGWDVDGEDARAIAAKGAPEAIAALCRLDGTQLEALHRDVDAMAAAGLRVLGLAQASHGGKAWPDDPRDFSFSFVGLVGLADPLRPSARDAIAECQRAGVRVVMITGDHPRTAEAIAREAGIASARTITGDELVAMDEAQLTAALRTASVFARILPEQKLRIVQALQRGGDVVAMTGDGVNDAPSLKAADIGIAMGGRGTDVAREAAAIVLLDDDFGAIVKAIGLGRRIYDNLRKAIGFILAVHVPVAGLALIPLLTGLPVLLFPVHIAFLEMIIDPVASLAFEAEQEETDVMRRPPRSSRSPFLPARLLGWGVLQGAVVLAIVACLYFGGHALGMPDDELRALAYFALVAGILALVLVNRSFGSSVLEAVRRPNLTLGLIFAAIGGVLLVCLFWPPASELFGFGPLRPKDLGIALGAGVATLAVLEAAKRLGRPRVAD